MSRQSRSQKLQQEVWSLGMQNTHLGTVVDDCAVVLDEKEDFIQGQTIRIQRMELQLENMEYDLRTATGIENTLRKEVKILESKVLDLDEERTENWETIHTLEANCDCND